MDNESESGFKFTLSRDSDTTTNVQRNTGNNHSMVSLVVYPGNYVCDLN